MQVVRVFSLTFLTEVQILAGHHAPVTGGVFYPGEKNTHYTYRLRVSLSWQLEKGRGKDNQKMIYRHKIPDPAKRICIFQPCSKEAGQLYGRWRHDKWMITGISFFLDVHSPEGRLFLLTSSKDGTVKAWDLKKGLCVESFRWTATCAHYSGCWRNAVVRKQKDAVGCWTFAK